MRSFHNRLLLVPLLLSAVAGPALAQREDLPSFGDSGVVSASREYLMGRVWLMSYRRQVPAVEDPLLEDYLETLVYRLAETSELKDRRLQLIIVKNPSINAFAVPGGVIGVHEGLVRQAETESELASVLAHELGHLSQRHFSRSVEAAQAAQIPSMVGMLAGMVAIAAGAGKAGMAGVMGSQAAAQQNRLRFSRLHEQEADRVGISNLARAGLDPDGAANMFTVMQRLSRSSGSTPYEFLLTHPLTETRIADARNRARQFPKRVYEDNPEFQLMRVRIEVGDFKNPNDAVATFREKLARKDRNAEAYQYGLVLALTRKREFAEASALLAPLRKFSPENLAYILAEADIYTESGEFDDALKLLGETRKLTPGNHPLTMAMSKAYLRSGRNQEAEKILKPHAERRRLDPYVWYVLAEAQGLSGNTYGVHQSRAEYFFLNGQMLEARSQLGYALRLAPDEIASERIRAQQQQVENAARALGQMK